MHKISCHNYVVKIDTSSEDTKLSKSFPLPKEMLVEVNKALVPKVPVNELKIAEAKLR